MDAVTTAAFRCMDFSKACSITSRRYRSILPRFPFYPNIFPASTNNGDPIGNRPSARSVQSVVTVTTNNSYKTLTAARPVSILCVLYFPKQLRIGDSRISAPSKSQIVGLDGLGYKFFFFFDRNRLLSG